MVAKSCNQNLTSKGADSQHHCKSKGQKERHDLRSQESFNWAGVETGQSS